MTSGNYEKSEERSAAVQGLAGQLAVVAAVAFVLGWAAHGRWGGQDAGKAQPQAQRAKSDAAATTDEAMNDALYFAALDRLAAKTGVAAPEIQALHDEQIARARREHFSLDFLPLAVTAGTRRWEHLPARSYLKAIPFYADRVAEGMDMQSAAAFTSLQLGAGENAQPIECRPYDVLKTYEKNELRAEETYTGKRITFTEMVHHVSRDADGYAFALCRVTEQRNVRAYPPAWDEATAAGLEQGDRVRITGLAARCAAGQLTVTGCVFTALKEN